MTSGDWYTNHSTLLKVAAYGIERGDFDTTEELLEFFTHPEHFAEVYEAWTATSPHNQPSESVS